MRIWPSCIACVALILLSGCTSVKEHMKPAQLESIEPEVRLDRVWSHRVGSAQDVGNTKLQPTVVDGIIYTTDSRGRVSARDAVTGRAVWQTSLNVEVGGGVGAGDGLVLLGTLDGRVIALDAENGDEKWQGNVSTEVVTIPQTNGNVVVAPTIDGRVFAFDHLDGRRRWSYDHPVPVLTLRGNAPPLMVGENLFIGFDNGQLLSFNADNGSLRWSARIGQPRGTTELERLVDVDAAPLASGPYIYGAGYNSRLVAMGRGNGRIRWAQDVSTVHNMAFSDNKIIVTDVNSHIHAFDASSGDKIWTNEQLHRRDVSAPGVIGQTVVVADFEGYVHSLALADGRFVGRIRARRAPVSAQPFTVGDLLYVYNNKGVLTAFSLRSLSNSSQAPVGQDTAGVFEN